MSKQAIKIAIALTIILTIFITLIAGGVLIVINKLELAIKTASPKIVKIRGTDASSSIGVKDSIITWREEDGYNVTHVTTKTPPCHRAIFNPLMFIANKFSSSVTMKLKAVSLTPSTTQLENLTIIFEYDGVKYPQILVRDGSIIQSEGVSITVAPQTMVNVIVIVKIGTVAFNREVAVLKTWLEWTLYSISVKQKIVWHIRTLDQKVEYTIFYDGFEHGNSSWKYSRNPDSPGYIGLETWGVAIVRDPCDIYPPGYPCPQPEWVIDWHIPLRGFYQLMIGYRDFYHEPEPQGDEYVWTEVNIPSEIDGVEVKYVNVTVGFRVESWDSANYDWLDIYVIKVGDGGVYLIRQYNPNPGDSYGNFTDSGWMIVKAIITGLQGSKMQLVIHLRTFSDSYYKTWIYIDEVYVKIEFACFTTASLKKPVGLIPLGIKSFGNYPTPPIRRKKK